MEVCVVGINLEKLAKNLHNVKTVNVETRIFGRFVG